MPDPGPTPLLSIITPVFNGERFLAGCIENVLHQRCANVEHLIIDGASTDRSLEIIRSYAQDNPSLHWVSERDRGQSDAMNKGITLARGKYLSFLNADDFYEPGTLSRVTGLIGLGDEHDTVRFLVGNCRLIDAEGKSIGVNRPRALGFLSVLAALPSSDFPINPSAYFYPRALHDKVGPYKEDEHSHMDLEFLLRALPILQVEYHDEVWGNFRVCEGTKSFASVQSGVLAGNLTKVMAPFRAQFWWPLRLGIALSYRFFNSHFYGRAGYAWREPRAALGRLSAKFHRRFTTR